MHLVCYFEITRANESITHNNDMLARFFEAKRLTFQELQTCSFKRYIKVMYIHLQFSD